MGNELEQRQFRADPLKLKRLRVAAGLTVQEFTQTSGLDRATAGKVLRGDPVFLRSLKLVGKRVFHVDSPLDLLHPDELHALGIQSEADSPNHVLEWTVDEYLTGWQQTSNGLQYQLVRLNHRFLDRVAIGKCYELRHLATKERERLETHLRRHSSVCERVGTHPNIVQNLTAAYVGGLWWVIDRWEPGKTLASQLSEGRLSGYALRTIMTGIACGIQALHDAEIIRRELSPRFVWLREEDDRPILTDLELSKLAEGVPSVSPGEWPDDPYRAMEVSGDAVVDARADIYSWGRVFVHAATAQLCGRGAEELPASVAPDAVRDAVLRCCSVARSQRPSRMEELIDAMKAWT